MPFLIAILIFIRPLVSGQINPALDLAVDILLFLCCAASFVLEKKIRKTPYDKIIFVFILSLLISCVFSSQKLNSIIQFNKYLTCIFIFYYFLLEKKRNNFLPIVIISALFISLYSLFHFFVISRYALCYLIREPNADKFTIDFFLKNRAFYPFVSPNLLGGYLTIVLAISLGFIFNRTKQFLSKKSDLLLFISSISFLVILFTLFFTNSLGVWGALFVACGLCFISRRKLSKRGIICFWIIFIFLAAIVLIRYNSDRCFSGLMITVSDRLVYWKDSLTVISKHIFAGVGLGNFSIEGSTYAYNSYLQFFAETGILGFVSLLGIAFIFIKNGSKKIRNSKDYLLISLFVAGTAFLFQNILDFSFFITQISFLWWMALGFVLSEDK